MSTRAVPAAGPHAFAIDASAVATFTLLVMLCSRHLIAMTVLVPAVIGARFLLVARLPHRERHLPLGTDVTLFALGTVLGASNDWMSVVRHGVYDYRVPVFFPELSTIPLWMLLSWGLILRFVVTLSCWSTLDPPAGLRATVHLGKWRVTSPGLRLALALALVVATRQCIYRTARDPLLSWLPFALALLIHGLVLRPDRHDRKLMALAATVGPAVEVLDIRVGGLHHYELGWIAGVPVWIVLWWVLGVPIWKEVSWRLVARLGAGARRPSYNGVPVAANHAHPGSPRKHHEPRPLRAERDQASAS